MGLPGYSTRSRTVRQVTLGYHGNEGLDTVTLDSGNTDAGNTPTTEFRPGNVVALVTSTGRYVEANDAAGDRNAQASATGTVTDASSNAGFGKTFKWKFQGGAEQTVTMGSTTASHDTNAEIVALLNANAAFAADLIAAESGNFVNIKSRRAGSDVHFQITAGTINAVLGFTDNSTYFGTDADYRVTRDLGILADADGTAVHDEVQAYRAGFFDESQLLNLTGEARAVLARRGSIFG